MEEAGMGDLLKFVRKYKRKGLDNCLKNQNCWPEIKDAQHALLQLNGQDSEDIKAILNKVVMELQERKESLLEEKTLFQENRLRAEKNRAVCLNYLERGSEINKQLKKIRRETHENR